MLLSFLATGLWAIAAVLAFVLALVLFALGILMTRRSPRLAFLVGLSVLAFAALIGWAGWIGLRARTSSPVLSDVQACASGDAGFAIPWQEAEPIEVTRQTEARQAAVVFSVAGSLASVLGVVATLAAMIAIRRTGVRPLKDVRALGAAALVSMLGTAACLPYLRDPEALARKRVTTNAVDMVDLVLQRSDCSPCPVLEDAAAYLGLPALESSVPGVRDRAHACIEARLQQIVEGKSELLPCCTDPSLNGVLGYLQDAAHRTPSWKREQLERLARSPLLADDAQKARIEVLRRDLR